MNRVKLGTQQIKKKKKHKRKKLPDRDGGEKRVDEKRKSYL